jgi:CRISPR-associated endonuclease/helicase Cas3
MAEETNKEIPLYYRYWGKAKPDAGSIGPAYHLLPYHCLDVAAVGYVLLEHHPFLAILFEKLFGLSKPVLIPWLNVLLTFHDCGKFAESFQQLKPELRQKWWGDPTKNNYDLRHDSLEHFSMS